MYLYLLSVDLVTGDTIVGKVDAIRIFEYQSKIIVHLPPVIKKVDAAVSHDRFGSGSQNPVGYLKMVRSQFGDQSGCRFIITHAVALLVQRSSPDRKSVV